MYFRRFFAIFYISGSTCFPRGLEIKELEDYTYVLPPRVRFTSFTQRNFNLDYVKKEFLWYLKGDRFDLSIQQHAKMWNNLVDTDGGINSNYGQYIFANNGKGINFVVDELKADKDSRRASIVILSEHHLKTGAKDVPCTYSLNFRIRNNRLKMSVRMRSQDAIFGMGNDAPCFSFIHECVYNLVKDYYQDLEMGDYTHTADSLHVYARHFDMLKSIVDSQIHDYVNIDCPQIKNGDEVRYLMAGKFDSCPTDFAFSRWLIGE